MISSYFLLPILFIQENILYYLASAGQLFNIFLYLKEVDYFNAVNWAMPTFHLWSLSFEVQIYFLIALIYSVYPKNFNSYINIKFLCFTLTFIIVFYRSDIYSEYFNPLFRSFMFVVGYFYDRLKFTSILFAIFCYVFLIGDITYFAALSLIFLIQTERRYNINLQVRKLIGILGHYSYEVYLIHWPVICFLSWYQ